METDKSKAEYWLGEITASLGREREYRKYGERVLKTYEIAKNEDVPFNILYANTEVLLPSLYSATPVPDVQRRHRDRDPLGLIASQVSNRLLSHQIDTNLEDYPAFDEVISSTVLDALLPGRGVTRVRYDAKLGTDGKVAEELVCVDHVQWDRYAHGYAKRWKDVPWVAYGVDMTLEDLRARFKGKVPATFRLEEPNQENQPNENDPQTPPRPGTLTVWELWTKGDKKVRFCAEGLKDWLEEADDPINAPGFFPQAEPLQLFARSNSLVPVSLYRMYEKQADELNRVSTRLNKVLEALRVRGVYDAQMSEIKDVIDSAGDNQLLPVQNARAFLQGGSSFDRAIWLMPLEKLIQVVQQLYIAREQIKLVIYEIIGLSDLQRAATKASESATAQNLKDKWGTLRLKRWQRKVATHVRSTLRLMLHVSVNKLDVEAVRGAVNLQLPTTQQVQQAMLQYQQQAAVAMQQGQQPPPAPEMFTLEDALGLLRSTIQRSWRVDIETNSTVDVDATTEKTDVSEFMNAVQQLMSGLQSAMQGGMMDFQGAKSLILAVVRRFRFGREVEQQIEAMQPTNPQAAEAEKKQADAEKALKGEQDKVKELLHKLEVQEMELKYQQQINELREQMAQLRLASQVGEVRQQLSQESNGLREQKFGLDLQRKDVEHANSKFQDAQRQTQQGAAVQQQAARQMQAMFKQIADAVVATQETTQQAVQQVAQVMEQMGRMLESMNQDVVAEPQPDGSWRRRRIPAQNAVDA